MYVCIYVIKVLHLISMKIISKRDIIVLKEVNLRVFHGGYNIVYTYYVYTITLHLDTIIEEFRFFYKTQFNFLADYKNHWGSYENL